MQLQSLALSPSKLDLMSTVAQRVTIAHNLAFSSSRFPKTRWKASSQWIVSSLKIWFSEYILVKSSQLIVPFNFAEIQDIITRSQEQIGRFPRKG